MHKVDDRINHEDLESCVNMLVEFYHERANSVSKVEDQEENGLGMAQVTQNSNDL